MKQLKPKYHYGIWIDLTQAMVCHRDQGGTFITEMIPSELETHPRFAGEGTDKTGLFGRTVNRQKKDQAHVRSDLHHFIDKVVGRLNDPGFILILGPAQVRFDLQNELESRKEFKELAIENRAAGKMDAVELEKALQHELAF